MLVNAPIFTNDAIVFGLLSLLLGLVFHTSSIQTGFWPKFYKVIPSLLLCYFLPSIFTSLGVIAPYWHDVAAVAEQLRASGFALPESAGFAMVRDAVHEAGWTKAELKPFEQSSQLYFVASRYFLPASLVLLCLGISFRELRRLGWKPVLMFLTGTVGVVIGGPLAILAFSAIAPEVVSGEVWRGMTTVAGSWIGGGANQAAMYEMFKPSSGLYSVMITVDIIVAEIWMAFLLLGVGKTEAIDRWLKADSSAVEELKQKMHEFSQRIARMPSLSDLMIILAIAFVPVSLSHWWADLLAPLIREKMPFLAQFSLDSSFFWLIVLATTFGLLMSATKLRNYEGAGASRIGSVFIYFLVASIGMKMNVLEIFEHPALFLVGLLWMAIHVSLMLLVARLIRAPFFFVAVGSKANIGGAASAPVVAAAFHPALAPVGVLLAVLGYALGTYGALICGWMMEFVAP